MVNRNSKSISWILTLVAEEVVIRRKYTDYKLTVSTNCKGHCSIMDLPFTTRLSRGFGEPGTSLTIRGKPHHHKAWFAFTFLDGMEILESRHDTPKGIAVFQMQPRFNEKLIVLNTCINGFWGMEERIPGFPLATGEINEIKITCQMNHYDIYINGTLFERYYHRLDKKIVTHFNFYGEFKITEMIYA